MLSSRRCLCFACQSLVSLARSHVQAGASRTSTEVINNQNKPKMPLSAQAATSYRRQVISSDIPNHYVVAEVPLIETRHRSQDRYRVNVLFSCPVDAWGQKSIFSVFQLTLLQHKLQLQNEDAGKMSVYIFKAVLKG